MRKSTPLMIAALMIAAPAAASTVGDGATANMTANDNATATDPLATDTNVAADPVNGVIVAPLPPPTVEPMDMGTTETAADDDDDRFPWGLLGLLGLAGLIPRKERPRRHDGAI